MKLLHVLFLFLFSFFTIQTFAAEDFSIWENEVFAGPYPADGVIATSPVFANNNGLSGLEINISYEEIVPDGANAATDYKLYAIVEQEASGHWYPAAVQLRHIKSTETAQLRQIIFGPNVPDYNGAEFEMWVGNTILVKAQSFVTGNLGTKFRVKLIVDNSGVNDLTSTTVSVWGKKFD